MSDEERTAHSERISGEGHPQWKGDAAGYNTVHRWRHRNRPKSGVCDTCGAEGRTDWANVSGEYRRDDETDWLELCRSCHSLSDRANPKRPIGVK